MNSCLDKFKELNPNISLSEDKDNYIISNPWNDETVKFYISKSANLKLIENIKLHEEFIALFHPDKIEYIYGPIHIEDTDIGKSFKLNYKKISFDCSFAPVSETLELLARSFIEGKTDSTSSYRNLRFFRDYYFKEHIFKEAHEYTTPISFFVEGNYDKIGNLVQFANTINFYLTYFQRSSPNIAVLKKNPTTDAVNTIEPCLSLFGTFPKEINAHCIDPVLLDIFLIARDSSNIRLKFIFYYQIMEYASYYYINNKLKNKLSQILKDPAISDNSNNAIKQIIEEMKDTFSQRDDYSKLEQTVTDFCKIEDIKNELSSNSEYFSKDHYFEGGFYIEKIIKEPSAIEYITDSDLLKILKNIDKIRNVLVHLRESRENKVILPTTQNENLIKPYLFVLFRMAEKVAIQFEK